MTRLAAYTRVSALCQKDNTSLEVQRDRIEHYAKAHGHELSLFCWDIESASGKVSRPGLELAFEAVRNGEIDGIICAKLDRFARSALDGLRLANELRTMKKQLVILDMSLDTTTAIGECLFTMLLAFAQFERRTINDRSQEGKHKVKELGGYVHGNPGYGYKSALAPGSKKLKVRVPVAKEQAWISKMLEWYKSGWTFRQISDELNKLAVPGKRGAKWTYSTVKGIVLRHAGSEAEQFRQTAS